MTDLHSHLVPDVDDGARTLEDALEGLGRMRAAGVRRVVTTPHFDASTVRDPERFEETLARMDASFEALRAASREAYPDVRVQRGHEVMLDDPFPELGDPRLHLGASRYVLVEWPRLRIPPSTPEVVSRIRAQGLVPLIAHPERYVTILKDFRVLTAWRKAGACLQMNHGSLLGRYGDQAQEAAFQLLEGGWVDVLSSDFHGRPHLPIFIDQVGAWFEERGQADVFELLTQRNPALILADERPEVVPSFNVDRGFWDRFKGLLRSRDA